MKKLFLFLAISSLLSVVNAQEALTLEKIWGGQFRAEYLQELRSMKDGLHYTLLEYDRAKGSTSINKYRYADLALEETLLNSAALKNLDRFQGYSFSSDESKILLVNNKKAIYRRSYLANFYVYDRASEELIPVAEERVQEATFSPDGSKVAYVFNNNLYVKDLKNGEVSQITNDGSINNVLNGLADWVYEEEFSLVRAFEWAPDNNSIAFIRFDESEVPEMSMDIFSTSLYPEAMRFKYPKPGEKNSVVSVHVYDLNKKNTTTVDLSAYNDFYVPRINWTPDAKNVVVTVLNRHQSKLDLLYYTPAVKTAKVVFTEQSDTYVDVHDNLHYLKDNSFIWTSEQDGFNHIYHYAADGSLKRQLTKGNWEVTAFYGVDEKGKKVYFQSTQDGSINRAISSVSFRGKVKKLSEQVGTNRAKFSASYKYYINTFSDAKTPSVFTLNNAKDGKQLRMIKDNARLKQVVAKHALSPKEYMTITTEKGIELNAWMVKPLDFDPQKEYPLLMYVYGGPGSQTVANSWLSSNDYWFNMLAQEGYIVVSVDNRGTGFKGAEFKKVTYKDLGKYEIEDQIDAAKLFGSYDYIDADRIGMFGWSFGGYMTSLAMTKGADVFSTGIAVAPVTNWRFYDTIYTERYLQTPQENPAGYDENSPINHVAKMNGNYMIISGSADDNVHHQNTMRMVEALVQQNVPFDMALYPDKNHGIYGGNTRLHLFTKMTKYLNENLKGATSEAKQHKQVSSQQ